MAVAAPPVSHDFNADGANDYPVSVTGYDPAAPVNGAARIWSGATKSIIDTIVSDDTNTLFGWSIGSAGDLDGDGFDDLIVGEPLWGPNGTLQGRVRVFSGEDSSVLLTATGPFLEAGLGRYVAGIGDWNGDGVPDIVSSGWDIADLDNDGIGDDPIGIVFVLSGVDGSVLAEIFEPTGTELFGYSVFGLGDITGDGLADIAVVDRGAEGAPGSGATGALYIFTGRAQTGSLSTTDAHRTILNDDPTLRGFAAHVDTMHPDLWLDEATLQIISLTTNGVGGPNEAETAIAIRKADGQAVGAKGVRPSLVLAGDVNLDGKVDALDLQVSIAQLGTNPQAIGVMPLADLNQDNIVDTHDVVLLLQDYGGETDIYEGLWDGSRLLATVGGNAGFGSIGTNPIGGDIAPGRRPIDDCLRDMPANDGPSLLPWLLRRDGRANCSGCPSCDAPDPQGCYKCHEPGRITGGQITVTPEQPKPGETVTFSWTPFELVGRSRKCQGGSCGGGEDNVCVNQPWELGQGWALEKKNPLTGQWEVIASPAISPYAQPVTTQNACAEIRLRLTTQELSADPPCARVDAVEKIKEVQFAEFTLDWECVATTPSNRRRTTVGIGEEINVWVVEAGAGEPTWTVNRIAGPPVSVTEFPVTASDSAGTFTVQAEINGCVRKAIFNVIEPAIKNYTPCPLTATHNGGQRHIQFRLKMDLDPDYVSFYNVAVRELSGPGSAGTGSYAGNEPGHVASQGWLYVKPDNRVIGRDTARASVSSDHPNIGTFVWEIPIEYGVAGGTVTHIMNQKILQEFWVDATCVSVKKGGLKKTGCSTDLITTYENTAGCGVNGD